MNPTEREKVERCASCGEQGASKIVPELDNAVLCDGCADRLANGETLGYWRSEEEPPLPPEERFAELEERFAPLCKAAQVLLREGIDEEDLIYPTLAFANELELRTLADNTDDLVRKILDLDEEAYEEADRLLSSAERSVDWETAVERASRGHDGMFCEKVVDGVVILRWFPVYGDVRRF